MRNLIIYSKIKKCKTMKMNNNKTRGKVKIIRNLLVLKLLYKNAKKDYQNTMMRQEVKYGHSESY